MKVLKMVYLVVAMLLILSNAACSKKVTLTGEEQLQLEVMRVKSDLDAQGRTALHIAAQEGELNICRYLIEVEKVDVNVRDERGMTPLHLAVIAGDERIIELLLDHKALIDAQDSLDWTPLLFATYGSDTKTSKLLLARGADVRVAESTGRTPLYFAAFKKARNSNYEIFDLLIKNGAKTDIFIESILCRLDEIEKLLRDDPQLVNARDTFKDTPLHYAAELGYMSLARMLIEAGADVNAKNILNITPIYDSALNGHKDITELLIANGADVNLKSNVGFSPLGIAVMNGHEDVADLLRRHGAVQ